MKVCELFASENLSQDDVVNVADLSDYWSGASNFVLENWNRDISTLSEPQAKWLTRIHDDMTEKRIEGRL